MRTVWTACTTLEMDEADRRKFSGRVETLGCGSPTWAANGM